MVDVCEGQIVRKRRSGRLSVTFGAGRMWAKGGRRKLSGWRVISVSKRKVVNICKAILLDGIRYRCRLRRWTGIPITKCNVVNISKAIFPRTEDRCRLSRWRRSSVIKCKLINISEAILFDRTGNRCRLVHRTIFHVVIGISI